MLYRLLKLLKITVFVFSIPIIGYSYCAYNMTSWDLHLGPTLRTVLPLHTCLN